MTPRCLAYTPSVSMRSLSFNLGLSKAISPSFVLIPVRSRQLNALSNSSVSDSTKSGDGSKNLFTTIVSIFLFGTR